MIRVKDIANMVGVSPTTVSNVIHGNTKRVSQETAQKISSILDEVGYIPNMGARLLSQNTSHIIGLVIGLIIFMVKTPCRIHLSVHLLDKFPVKLKMPVTI